MSQKIILLIILFIWGFPSTYFRSKFRKIVYQTDDWKINIKPIFLKEIKYFHKLKLINLLGIKIFIFLKYFL
jgi:septation ring formation regulator EzrA